MILDTIDRFPLYAQIAPAFQKAAAFLAEMKLDNLEPGRIEIAGEDAYGIVSARELKAPNCVWEAHVRYADVQIVLAGAERIDWGGALVSIPGNYNAALDLYTGPRADGISTTLKPGRFAIFLPLELHGPNNPAGSGGFSKKLVIKVRMDGSAKEGTK